MKTLILTDEQAELLSLTLAIAQDEGMGDEGWQSQELQALKAVIDEQLNAEQPATLALYAFQPEGHGPQSFFTVAASEKEARASVARHIAETGYSHYETSHLEEPPRVFQPGEVAENDNS